MGAASRIEAHLDVLLACASALLLVLIVITGACLGIALFRERFPRPQDEPSESFNDFQRALTTMFVYISLHNNFPDLVFATLPVSPAYMVFLATYMVFGSFFIIALIIGWFQASFVM